MHAPSSTSTSPTAKPAKRAILAALGESGATIPGIVAHVYAAVDRRLWPAAGRQVLAHLIALEAEGRVRSEPLGRDLTSAEAGY